VTAGRPGARHVIAVITTVAGLVATAPAEAHLFHKGWEPPETQLTRDTRTLRILLVDPEDRFALARAVWEGTTRVRYKPGGFRRWLVRPNEPGMVFKADYQLERWSGSLRGEALRIDAARGSRLAPRMDEALTARDRDSAEAVLREMYVVLLDELLESLWQRIDDPNAAEPLYGYVLGYYAVNLEAHLNIRHPVAATTARSALDAISRALADGETGAPASPEAFARQRARFLRVLAETVPGAVVSTAAGGSR
jgi:hypothetical protein